MATKHLWVTPLTANTLDQKEELGIVRREWNSTDSCFKTYKYVQASLTATAANGIPLSFYGTTGTVAQDLNDNGFNNPAGVVTGTLTNSYYGWIQVGGYHSAVKTNGDDDIADGASIVLGRAKRVVDSVAAGTASSVKLLGIAVAADVDADDTVATLLCCDYADIT